MQGTKKSASTSGKTPASDVALSKRRTSAKARPKSEEVSAKGEAKSGGKSILIAEDERPLAHALEMKLRNEGYQVRTVTNGKDALTEILRGNYGLILLDLIMPQLDGFGVLEELKARHVRTPVIVLSNLGQEEDKAKAKALGAVDYYVKSNTPVADIVSKVKSIF